MTIAMATRCGVDAVIVDLEDGVAPAAFDAGLVVRCASRISSAFGFDSIRFEMLRLLANQESTCLKL
jgi:citrate lyase beta subunit